jgi:prolyl-tRNA synthetase
MEFLWQEGHTAHATVEEAQEETLRMLDVYTDFAVNDAAIPVIPGRKSESEKFPGADASYSIEAMMGDGRALQSGTSHNLGQNFAKAFEIQYQDENSELQYCWTTSWGVSTRMVGAIIMTHGDDQGLVLPPQLAPIQVVIIPIWKKNRDDEKRSVMEAVAKMTAEISDDVRVRVDDRDGYSPGWKFNEWELKGVPLRIEIGPRDVDKGEVILARRDQPGKEGKSSIPLTGISAAVNDSLTAIQSALLQRATDFRDENTSEAGDYDQLKAAVATGFARAWWCGNPSCEDQVKADTQATTRCMPIDQPGGGGECVVCGESAKEITVFARAY